MQTYDRQRCTPHASTSILVILRLWGCTTNDTKDAEAAAKQWCARYAWDIVELIRSTGTPCPIPPHDSIALNQDTDYNAVWALYRASTAFGSTTRFPPTTAPP
jgi:hypothetical protein